MSKQRAGIGKRSLVFCAALLLAGLAVFVPGQANKVFAQAFHAVLVHTDPTAGSVLTHAPASIHLWFSEPVQLAGQALTIFGPSGNAIIQGPIQNLNGEVSVPLSVTTDGTYLVTWQVISQDTDPVSGSFIFSLGHAGGPWTGQVNNNVSLVGFWLQILGHLLHFLGYALSFGSLAFFRLVVYPRDRARQDILQQPIWRLVNAGILILLFAEGVALLAQAASLGMHSLFDLTFLGTVLGSSFGRVLALRLGAALMLWILTGIAQQGNKSAVTIALILGSVLAVIDSTASHAISSPLVWLALFVTVLHIMAMGIWLGGVIALLSLWRLEAARAYRHDLVARFGPIALASVVELVLTGIVLSGLHLVRLTDLFTTSYGHILAIKVVALLLPILFAFLGRKKHLFARDLWWLLEIFSLAGMLTLAAILASLPPPR